MLTIGGNHEKLARHYKFCVKKTKTKIGYLHSLNDTLGLELNGLIFLFLLTVLPSFEFKTRLISVITFLIFVFSYRWGYRLVSQTIIEPKAGQPNKFKDKYPKLTFLFITLLSAIISGFIGWGINAGLDKYLPKIVSGFLNYQAT